MTFLPVDEIIELALPDGNLLPTDDCDAFNSKLGGRAVWMHVPAPVSLVESLKCRLCGTELFLLLQMDVPRPDEFPTVDRVAYVFVCNTRKCSQDARGWRVIFMAKKNRPNKSVSASSEDKKPKSFWDSIMEDEAEKGGSQSKLEDEESSSKYKSKSKSLDNQSISPSINPASLLHNSKHQFPGIYLHIEEEIIIEKRADKKANNRLDEIKVTPEIVVDNNNNNNNGEEDWSGEQYEKFRAPGTDKSFSRFQKRVAHYPRQCVRYAASSAAPPLLYHDLDLLGEVNKLEACGCCRRARDRFELQLMPAILAFLPTESDKFIAHIPKNRRSANPMISDGMEWGSVFVYSCGNSCPNNNDREEEEEAVVIYEGTVIIQLELTI